MEVKMVTPSSNRTCQFFKRLGKPICWIHEPNFDERFRHGLQGALLSYMVIRVVITNAQMGNGLITIKIVTSEPVDNEVVEKTYGLVWINPTVVIMFAGVDTTAHFGCDIGTRGHVVVKQPQRSVNTMGKHGIVNIAVFVVWFDLICCQMDLNKDLNAMIIAAMASLR